MYVDGGQLTLTTNWQLSELRRIALTRSPFQTSLGEKSLSANFAMLERHNWKYYKNIVSASMPDEKLVVNTRPAHPFVYIDVTTLSASYIYKFSLSASAKTN